MAGSRVMLQSRQRHTSLASFFSGGGKRTLQGGVGVEAPELGAEEPTPELLELLRLLLLAGMVWAGGGEDLAEHLADVGDRGG